MIFLRDMETLPVSATVSGISFVSSIVFSTSSSNNEIYYQHLVFMTFLVFSFLGGDLDGLRDGVRDR